MNFKYRLIFPVLFFLALTAQAQQPTNADATKGYYNVTVSKTPEAEGIEQFGKVPVNELTGTPDISIPISFERILWDIPLPFSMIR
ncbi:hypothetical protein [Puia sp.]|jgi:hypothetical protein|uniref:hypothetical protein n=1 Tax=Puia sp. TaxID=2045100 RepID=UPI002F42F956